MIQVIPKLIGIHGKAGSGKDVIATYLHKTRPNTWTEAFANPLKAAAAAMYGIPLERFNDREHKELPNDYWNVSPRQIAQFFGTEMVRNTIGMLIPEIGTDFWVKRMEGRLTNQLDDIEYEPGEVVVIPDVRFQNEYDWVLAQGGIIIHLTRSGADGIVGIRSHASEAGISNIHTLERNWPICNDKSLDELYAEVDKCVSAYSIYPKTLSNPNSF